jgi:molybdopterin/thiamine biosynthesis adenylyltransferase
MDRTDRYSRQELFDGLGKAGQAKLSGSKVVIVGLGALGSIHAEALARAGIGELVLIDRDFVEESNLQRQIMFEESDARDRLPKAVAAASHVSRINSGIKVEPIVTDVTYANIEQLARGADLIMDGTDNFGTRYLINDASAKLRIPWIYGAAVGSYGLTMTVVPGVTPCLRCLFESMPEPGLTPTCDTDGVIFPIIGIIASIQVAEAMKLLAGCADKLHRSLVRVDVWDFQISMFSLEEFAGSGNCPVCAEGEFEYLRGDRAQLATTLCGRDAVQVTSFDLAQIDLARLADQLEQLGEVKCNEFLLRFCIDGYDITVFRDARSIIRGTSDPIVAKGLYSKYVGG